MSEEKASAAFDAISKTQPAITPMDAALAVEQLLAYALRTGLIEPLDVVAARNALLAELRLDEPHPSVLTVGVLPASESPPASPTAPRASAAQAAPQRAALELLLDYAVKQGFIQQDTTTLRDLYEAKLMGLLMPRPSDAAKEFRRLASKRGITAATDYWYRLSIDSCYIRMDRIAKNKIWRTPTPFGDLEITINLSKPEKDPKEIAMLKNVQQTSYPKCLLCVENVGYAGRIDHPARQNLRMLPLELTGEQWYFQYSPYVYYNEHGIVLNGEHVPMRITPGTFRRLLAFLGEFPHYFVGSNADLPIVGGSILSHDHYQAGRYSFPLQRSPELSAYMPPGCPDVRAGIVNWPLSVVRLTGREAAQLLSAADALLAAWRSYSDPAVGLYAFSNLQGEPLPPGDMRVAEERVPHNTITPIARLNEQGEYELDLVLRNNRTDAEHPDGIYHPHRHLHHIKRENIGLIEVMGLAVLPARLDHELDQIANLLSGSADAEAIISEVGTDGHPLHHHADWIAELVRAFGADMTREQAVKTLQRQVGLKFLEALSHCGVFKLEEAAGREAFNRFLTGCGYKIILHL